MIYFVYSSYIATRFGFIRVNSKKFDFFAKVQYSAYMTHWSFVKYKCTLLFRKIRKDFLFEFLERYTGGNMMQEKKIFCVLQTI